MEEFVRALDELPLGVKIVLALPGIDIIWGIYRIVDGICRGSVPQIILGAVWVFAGTAFCWVLDIIFLLVKGEVLKL